MSLDWLSFLLQTADALFPTGGYAHSLGFEESVRLGLVHDEASLLQFLQSQIIPAHREHELPYLRFAFEAASEHDLPALCLLDEQIGAWKLAFETRQASVQLGGRRLKAVRTIADSRLLADFESRVESGEAAGHHLIVFALQAVSGKIPLQAALNAYLYQSLAAHCAAALKLIRIGQDACQRVLRQACATAGNTIAQSLKVESEQAGWFNPLLEIASMRHQQADERMFIS